MLLIEIHKTMKNKVLRHSMNFQLEKFDCETIKGKSMTIPGQSYSINEILDKFTRGITLAIGKTPQYEENDDYENEVNYVDITEVAEHHKTLQQKISYEKSQAKLKADVKANEAKKGSEAPKEAGSPEPT
nr:MAG: hypothetical protein [Microvirus sp.]